MGNTTTVEQLVERYFEQAKNPLKLMHSKALAEITYRMVDCSNNNAAESIFKLVFGYLKLKNTFTNISFNQLQLLQ